MSTSFINSGPESRYGKASRRTLRLTFRASGSDVKLVSTERLGMICPPVVGERPEAGRNSGFWLELRDKENRVIFHRILHAPFGNSVEVHSPDGKIRREFGPLEENIFQVLVPDDDNAGSVALMGEWPEKQKTKRKQTAGESGGSYELVRFDVSAGDTDATQGGAR